MIKVVKKSTLSLGLFDLQGLLPFIYSRKIAPTVSIIHNEIKDYIKISKSKLTLTLIDLGYNYKKIGDNRRVLYDQASIDFQTTQERQHYSSPGDGHHPLIWPETLNNSR
jgi:hypothetical protein